MRLQRDVFHLQWTRIGLHIKCNLLNLYNTEKFLYRPYTGSICATPHKRQAIKS